LLKYFLLQTTDSFSSTGFGSDVEASTNHGDYATEYFQLPSPHFTFLPDQSLFEDILEAEATESGFEEQNQSKPSQSATPAFKTKLTSSRGRKQKLIAREATSSKKSSPKIPKRQGLIMNLTLGAPLHEALLIKERFFKKLFSNNTIFFTYF